MSVFDPLSYESLGKSIIQALEEQQVEELAGLKKFDGAGVYALYYYGKFKPYALLATKNAVAPGSWPIYIGKAEASKSRKGFAVASEEELGDKLYKRIMDHKKSIEQAENLDVQDFQVRYLSVAPTWVPLAETIALSVHQPVWNVVIDGLGNHAPGSGRSAMKRPKWDIVHPGRPWAAKLRIEGEARAEIINKAKEHLAKGQNELLLSSKGDLET